MKYKMNHGGINYGFTLDELDQELEWREHSFVQYADDCNIYVSSYCAAERVLESTKAFVEQKMRLQVNEAKSEWARRRGGSS